MKIHFVLGLGLISTVLVSACFGNKVNNTFRVDSIPSFSKDSLPGKGLSQHPFLYAGEWQNSSFKDQKMYIVKGGKIVWTYTMPQEGEYGDATLLSNGNVLFSRFHGASEVTQDQKVVWNYDAPKNTEVHTCQPIGKDKVFMMLNAVPAKAFIMNKSDNSIEKELTIPTGGKKTHTMFRHCRYTKEGTFLIAQMDMNKVIEYDEKGNVLWSVDALSPWAAVRLKNGNTLISGNSHGYLREVNKAGEVVWELTQQDLPNIKLYTIQQAERLANGNTVFANWNGGKMTKEQESKTAQIIEVTKDKKVVWVLSEWDNPNLGRASGIQLLDEKGKAEKGALQR